MKVKSVASRVTFVKRNEMVKIADLHRETTKVLEKKKRLETRTVQLYLAKFI